MLKLKTYLKEVPGKGIGLFADQDIKKDQLVSKFEFPDIAITVDKFVELDELTQDHFYYYGWLESNVVHLSADNDKFTNHSKDPNLYDSGDSSYALRDIKMRN